MAGDLDLCRTDLRACGRTLTPILLQGLDFDLSWLLIIAPIVCVFLALWLPHALRNSSAAKGTAHRESLNESIKGAAEFINGVPVWRSLMVASTLTFVAGTTVIMGYSVGVGDLLGRDAANLQIIFAATWLVALGICWEFSTSSPSGSLSGRAFRER